MDEQHRCTNLAKKVEIEECNSIGEQAVRKEFIFL
jgi:hypothetical protein